jgi:SAM-dependent methyltransferase
MAAVSSHLPADLVTEEVVGLGLNEDELKTNSRLDRYVIHDINKNPILPFNDNEFNIVINTVSVQYITRPYAVFGEVRRVLKPGGMFIVVFSNRSFPNKEIRVWELLTGEERINLVRIYYARAGGFGSPEIYISMGLPRPAGDKYTHLGIPSDPVYAVFAEKEGGPTDHLKRVMPQDTIIMPSPKELARRKAQVAETMVCPYCRVKLHKWKITDNPWSTWDHDLYVCINDACPYVIQGWREMYEQGNCSISYRLVYDKEKNAFLTVPVPNLNAIKDSIQ